MDATLYITFLWPGVIFFRLRLHSCFKFLLQLHSCFKFRLRLRPKPPTPSDSDSNSATLHKTKEKCDWRASLLGYIQNGNFFWSMAYLSREWNNKNILKAATHDQVNWQDLACLIKWPVQANLVVSMVRTWSCISLDKSLEAWFNLNHVVKPQLAGQS